MRRRPQAVHGMAVAGFVILLAGSAVAQISDEPDALIEKCLAEELRRRLGYCAAHQPPRSHIVQS